MMHSKRLSAFTLAIATVCATAAPAMASSSHWSAAKCGSYAGKYHHPSKSQRSGANKTLKSHGCKVTVK